MAGPDARVEVDRAALERLLDTDAVTAARRSAEKILARARTTAPVLTGSYRDGLTIAEATDPATGRTVVRVGSTVDHAGLVEGETGNIASALDAAAEA